MSLRFHIEGADSKEVARELEAYLAMLVLPGPLQSADGACRQPPCSRAEERHKRPREVAGGDAAQVQQGQELPNPLGPLERYGGTRLEVNLTPLPGRSRALGTLTATGPAPVGISRSGRQPLRTMLIFPSGILWETTANSLSAIHVDCSPDRVRHPLQGLKHQKWAYLGKAGP